MSDHPNFFNAILYAFDRMSHNSTSMHRGKWQGVDVSKRPEMEAYELLHYHMRVPMTDDLHRLQADIKPNIPWADDHFAERVSGNPLNPGTEWKNWPWGKNADKFRIDHNLLHDPGPQPIFDHTYSQRYWPKWAGRFQDGVIPSDFTKQEHWPVHRGIYFDYGDLSDIIAELVDEPTTRQAILPMFFPEDTGLRPARRKPCSISYHFMLSRQNKLDVFYHLRSCDLIRHFRDDIYLTVRLALWVLERCRDASPAFWNAVAPGDFVMMIGNLHCFKNDWLQLRGKIP